MYRRDMHRNQMIDLIRTINSKCTTSEKQAESYGQINTIAADWRNGTSTWGN